MRAAPTSDAANEALWPPWTPLVEAAIATFLAVLVAFEPREGLGVAARVVLSAIPALVWWSCALPKPLPFLARASIIIAAVAVLIWYPAKFDVAPFFLVLLIGESVVVAPLWQSVIVTAASAGLLVGLDVAGRFDGSFIWLLAMAFAWSGTALLQSRLRLIGEIGERAAAEERQRIARELHDVIAHTLAVTMLQLTGARLALERDPADAARALAEAERLGRQSLAELRQAVGLLAPGEAQSFSALPTATDIPDLVREVSDAGLVVRLDCDGDLASVPPTAGLAMYRIVQESLANVARHAAPAPARVSIKFDDGHVCVDVRNPAPERPPLPSTRDGHGLGLVVMRERAEAVGGTLRAGLEDGEWRVNAVMPGARQS